MERQQGNSILTNSKETLRKVIDIEKERDMIEDMLKERDIMKKEKDIIMIV